MSIHIIWEVELNSSCTVKEVSLASSKMTSTDEFKSPVRNLNWCQLCDWKEFWKSLVARLHQWEDRNGGAIVTDLWPPMTPNNVSSVVYGYRCWNFHTILPSRNIGKVFQSQTCYQMESLAPVIIALHQCLRAMKLRSWDTLAHSAFTEPSLEHERLAKEDSKITSLIKKCTRMYIAFFPYMVQG